MSNYPCGMTAADFAYLDGAPDWFEYALEELAPTLVDDTYALYEDFCRWSRRQEEPSVEQWWDQLDKSGLYFEEEAA